MPWPSKETEKTRKSGSIRLPVWPLPALCGKGPVPKVTGGSLQTKQLTCPLENMNTRAAPVAVIAQVKKVPSKAWTTEL